MRILTLISFSPCRRPPRSPSRRIPRAVLPLSQDGEPTRMRPLQAQTASPKVRRSPALKPAGYASVSDLKKDDQGVWRGSAMKDGKRVNVSLDFQGNVVAR